MHAAQLENHLKFACTRLLKWWLKEMIPQKTSLQKYILWLSTIPKAYTFRYKRYSSIWVPIQEHGHKLEQ